MRRLVAVTAVFLLVMSALLAPAALPAGAQDETPEAEAGAAGAVTPEAEETPEAGGQDGGASQDGGAQDGAGGQDGAQAGGAQAGGALDGGGRAGGGQDGGRGGAMPRVGIGTTAGSGDSNLAGLIGVAAAAAAGAAALTYRRARAKAASDA